jgi:hypothetical protein
MRLAPGLKGAAIAGLVLSGLVGLLSLNEAAGLANFSALKESPVITPPWADERLMEAVFQAQLKSLEAMREARAFTLLGQTIACAVVFGAALRLLRPLGLSRERVRQMLGGSALLAAIFRTIDGAQFTVVMRKVAIAVDESGLGPASAGAEAFPNLMRTMATGFAAAQTLLVAGGFLMLALYFRSEKVKQLIATLEGPVKTDF